MWNRNGGWNKLNAKKWVTMLFTENHDITQIEEEVRTLTGYKFDQCNDNGKTPWYDAKAYSDDSKLQNKMNAISSAYSELNRSRSEYVRFYMKNHETIPTWIMIKVVNFSTFIDVLSNSKNGVTRSIWIKICWNQNKIA